MVSAVRASTLTPAGISTPKLLSAAALSPTAASIDTPEAVPDPSLGALDRGESSAMGGLSLHMAHYP